MRKINVNEITEEKKDIIAEGLKKYDYIMKHYQAPNAEFEQVYRNFYLKSWWKTRKKQGAGYFKTLREYKGEGLLTVIKKLQREMDSKKYDFSVATKLMHTFNPNLPIYDSIVCKYLEKQGLRFLFHRHYIKRMNCEEKIEQDWKLLQDWYKNFLPTEEAKSWIRWFDENFPDYKWLTDLKKVDFIIFACARENKKA